MTLPSRLTERYLAGDRRALARAITLAESNHPASGELLAQDSTTDKAITFGIRSNF